ncbi:hypothetical protein HMPREF9371_1729 [Neisseria shayeganii 871]|uniref:Uncharacterized protein n=1 Tax=Neisseria shayeganii 871 TaxID=1032488 RepID=G4CJD9_9NEIS|nr:hypothetical protein HMPREF9371_1729 [Neisseria shayeganii 871]
MLSEFISLCATKFQILPNKGRIFCIRPNNALGLLGSFANVRHHVSIN